MTLSRRTSLVLALTLVSGCVVRNVRGPLRPGAMTYDEAVSRALSYAQSRGYQASIEHAELTGKAVWKVKLLIARPGANGKLWVDFDAYTREIVKSKEKLKGPKDRDDDHDDDHRGKGHDKHGDKHGHGRGHDKD